MLSLINWREKSFLGFVNMKGAWQLGFYACKSKISQRIYYQYNPKHLSICTLTIHGLLHICDNIWFCGPIWTTWTFWMECYCGYRLQSGLWSHVHPWVNLNNCILHKAYIDQIDIYYGLDDELKTTLSQGLSCTEWLIEGCTYHLPFL